MSKRQERECGKNGRRNQAARGDGYGDTEIAFPAAGECHEVVNNQITANGTANSTFNQPAVVVWGTMFLGTESAEDHPHPWFEGNMPHATDTTVVNGNWSLGPFTVQNGWNTLIIWVAFEGEENIQVLDCPFRVADDCPSSSYGCKDDEWKEQTVCRLDEIETSMGDIKKAVRRILKKISNQQDAAP